MRSARAILLLPLLVVLAGCAPVSAAGTDSAEAGLAHIEVDGRSRSFLVRLPDQAAAGEPLPLLLVLHGANGSATIIENMSGLTEDANDEGFIVVYPEGTPVAHDPGRLAWNAGGCCGEAARSGIDDVAFIDSLLDELLASYPIDESRIYGVGFSNGGMLDYQLACEIGDRFAGLAAVSTSMLNTECRAPTPLSLLIIHGTADDIVPYQGGPPNAAAVSRYGAWTNASVEDATETWVTRDRCGGDPVTTTAGVATTESWQDCAEGTRIEVVTVDGGRHLWPRLDTVGVDGGELILEFFEQA